MYVQCNYNGSHGYHTGMIANFACSIGHATIRTKTRFWRSQILGILPGNVSKFEQGKYCSNPIAFRIQNLFEFAGIARWNSQYLRSPKTCLGYGFSVGSALYAELYMQSVLII